MFNINCTRDSDSDDASSTESRTPSASSHDHATQQPPEPWQCKYTGKVCLNPRAKKTNGKLHRLCQHHRIKANDNQRRLQLKRRLARAQMRTTPYPLDYTNETETALQEGWESWMSAILDDTAAISQQQMQTVHLTAPEPLNAPNTLTEEDVEWLSMLFASASSDDAMALQPYQAMRLFSQKSEN